MFYAIQIPACPGFGFTGGPQFQTDIQNVQSGNEKRNGDWAICRHKYTVPFANISDAAYIGVKETFLICRGRLHSFLHKDWADFKASNEVFGQGDGTTTTFQLKKVSTMGGGSYTRNITKPAAGVIVTVGSEVATSYIVDTLTGIVTFTDPPLSGTILKWSGEFFVQVRFDIDFLPFSLDNYGGGSYMQNGSVDIIEVLGE